MSPRRDTERGYVVVYRTPGGYAVAEYERFEDWRAMLLTRRRYFRDEISAQRCLERWAGAAGVAS